MPRLLALAARSELTGRVDVEGEATRSLYFDAGRVVGATSSAPLERVEEVALRLGLVTREQHRLVATSAAPLSTRRAALLLLERGFLKPNELGPLVRRRTEEVVFGAFGDPGARFRWAATEVPADESTTLERTPLQLAVEGVRRRWLAPEIDAVLGGDATLVSPVATGPGAAELGLSPEERRILALADGLRTLDEIVAGSPIDPLSTRQALAALVLVGTLAVRTFQGGRPAAAASAAIDLGRVREKLDQVRRADYFVVLGIGRLCTPHEVRESFERLRAEYDPRRFQGVREDGLEERLDEIQRVIADARDVLADDRLRSEYLRGLGE
jgi:YD repeat-containing protein